MATAQDAHASFIKEKGRFTLHRRNSSRSLSQAKDLKQRQEQSLLLEKGYRVDGEGQRDDEFGRLLSWNDIEPWQQDNEFIHSGYRPATASLRDCIQSLGYLHNETVNIYSHICGAMLFSILPVYIYITLIPRYIQADTGDLVVFTMFFSGVSICFMLSALYHTLASHSEAISAFGNQLDHLGIVILMWGSTIPTIYYGFYCNETLQHVYWSVTTVLSIISAVATMDPRFRNPALRPFRAAMYVALGCSALAFIAHSVYLYGWELQSHRMSLEWMGIMAFLNLVGAVAYATRMPERLLPACYDFVGGSHQIMHFMVIFAAMAHLVGLLKAFDFVHDFPAC
ncbi:hemolysin-iii channel protein [Phlyctema vagabunda]|uniref:Hemolysin-iii channel protein n=1 Tax=Phlyctema vagabunda TaxID=108571 RepID=A0ABR4P816_9HELO